MFVVNSLLQSSLKGGEAGIRRTAFVLLGGPGETKETVAESLCFAATAIARR